MVRLRCCTMPLGTASRSRPTLHLRALLGRRLTTGPALARPSGATPTDLFTTRVAQRVALRAGRRDRCGGACSVRVGRLWTRRSSRSIRRWHHPVRRIRLVPATRRQASGVSSCAGTDVGERARSGGGGTAVEKLAMPCPSEGSTGIDPQRRHVVVWGPAGTLAQNRCRREGVGAGLGMSPSVCAVHSGRAR
jgi:hypothetical protein